MRLPKLPFLLLALLLAASTLQAQAPTIEAEPSLQAGAASVSIRVFGDGGELKGSSPGAEIRLNRRVMGYSPLLVEALAPGTYLVEVSAPGYRPQAVSLDFVEKTFYRISFALERRMGFLSLSVEPADARVRIDGGDAGPGVTALATGRHEVSLSRFGYVSHSYLVDIAEDSTASLVARLELAPFDLGVLSSPRPAFDPRNAAAFGSAPLAFRVSSWGSGSLEILDASGLAVASWDFQLFDTWSQRVIWKGRDPAGLVLPDGDYRAVLVAWPRTPGETPPDTEAKKLRQDLELRIDSRLALSPFGSAGAVLGLLHFPEPGRIAPGTTSLGLSLQAGQGSLRGLADLGFQSSLAHSFGRLSLAASLGLGGQRSGSGAASGNASLGLAWALREAGSPFAAALAGRLAWLGEAGTEASWTRADLGQGLSLELGLPLALAFGAVHLGIDPGLRLGIGLGSGGPGPSLSPLARAGLWYGSYSLRAGLSALGAPTDWAGLLEGRIPLSVAAEFHWVPGASPLALTAALGLDLEPGLNPEPSLALGLDFLF